MHSEKSCEKCCFVVIPDAPGQMPLFCKRFPPQMNVVGANSEGKAIMQVAHIQVHPQEWCHEFKDRDEAPLFRESVERIVRTTSERIKLVT